MPIRSQPTPSDLARKVELAISVFGTDKKSAIVEYVAAHPAVYSGEIRREVRDKAGRPLVDSTLARLLSELVRDGVLVHDVQAVALQGHSPRYSVDQGKVAELVDAFVEKMSRLQSGPDRPPAG